MKIYKNKSFIASFIFTIIVIVFIFKYISLDDIINAVNSVQIKYILIGFIFHFLAYFFRTLVFYSFLTKENVNFNYLLQIHFIQNFYVHIIPASLGEFSFPLLLKKRIDMTKSFSVLVISRIISLALILFLFLTSGIYLFNFLKIIDLKSNIYTLLNYSGLILLIVVLFIIFTIKSKINIQKIIINNKILNKINSKFIKIHTKIKSEMFQLKNVGFIVKIIFYSLLALLCSMTFSIILLKGINIELNIFQVIFVSSIGVAFLILPIKSIGGFGTTEGSWAIGLMLFGISKQTALQAGFVVHIFALINVVFFFLIGIIFNTINNRNVNLINKYEDNET